MSAVQIPLLARDGSVKAYALVDAEDAPAVSRHRWYLSNGYAKRDVKRGGVRGRIYLHRQLMGMLHGDGREVDHINLNKLDCRRTNMRDCTHAENSQNQPIRRKTSSRHTGVSLHGQSGRWRARAFRGGRETHIGLFSTEIEAARAYQAWAARNFPAKSAASPAAGRGRSTDKKKGALSSR